MAAGYSRVWGHTTDIAHPRDAIAGLCDPPQCYRFTESIQSVAAHDATNQWVGFFAHACTRAVADAELFEQRVSAIQADWRKRIPDVRSDATARILTDRLPETPIVTVNAAAATVGRSFPATNDPIQRLVQAGILFATKTGLRNRAKPF